MPGASMTEGRCWGRIGPLVRTPVLAVGTDRPGTSMYRGEDSR